MLWSMGSQGVGHDWATEWQTVKSLPSMRETQVRSLDREDPLEKGMAAHCSILAWRISYTEEPDGLQSMGLQSMTQQTNFFTLTLLAPTVCAAALRIPAL